jgi:hypothetical protein
MASSLGLDRVFVERISNRFYAIRARCVGGNRPHASYAGRGIECRFSSAEDFVAYCASLPGSYDPSLEADRIDNDGPYERGNIRFASRVEQCRNRRGVHSIEHQGRKYTAVEFRDLFCPRYRDAGTVARKARAGFSAERIIAEQDGCRGAYLRHS